MEFNGAVPDPDGSQQNLTDRISDGPMFGAAVHQAGVAVEVSDAYAELLGYSSAEDLVGRNLFRTVLPLT